MFNVYQFDRKMELNDQVERMKQHYVNQGVDRKGIITSFTFSNP